MRIHDFEIPDKELKFQFDRSSGAGGQNVNKVNTKATLFFHVAHSSGLPQAVKTRFVLKWKNRISADGTLVLSSDRFRTQKGNIEDVLEKFAEMLAAVAKPPKKRHKTKPSKGSIERRLTAKKIRSENKNRRKPVDY